MTETQNVLLIFVSHIGKRLKAESGNEHVTRPQQLYSAQFNATFLKIKCRTY